MHIQANLGLRLERFGVAHRHWPSAVLRKEELGRRREREREERRREYAAAEANAACAAPCAAAPARADADGTHADASANAEEAAPPPRLRRQPGQPLAELSSVAGR